MFDFIELDGYWLYINGHLYIDYFAISFNEFINIYLKNHSLKKEDLNDAPIAFGIFQQSVAIILYNSAEINELRDWLLNYFNKIYIEDKIE